MTQLEVDQEAGTYWNPPDMAASDKLGYVVDFWSTSVHFFLRILEEFSIGIDEYTPSGPWEFSHAHDGR